MAPRSPRQILATVRAFVRQHDLLTPGPLVVAVSGGTDSTALALILAELRDEFGLVLHVAHFDHRARPRAARADAQYVADLANRIDAPVRIGRADAPTKSEDDARSARYAFLRRVAQEVGANAIATGHTQDDQAETVLLHLTRGAGIAGLAGMRPLRDGIARPLLVLTREDTAAICRSARIAPREDPTNRSLRFARNRVRRRVLPELARINPQVKAALARFAEAAAELEVPDLAGPAGNAARPAPNATRARDAIAGADTTIDLSTLPTHGPTRGRILADAWRSATGRTLTARHRSALLELTRSSAGTRTLDLPGGRALREYATFRIAAAVEPPVGTSPTPLKQGTTTEWHGWRIAVDMAKNGLPFGARFERERAALLVVRARRPGDRIGRHKIQDVFVDAKVPLRLRDRWPVIAVNDDVVWVPGLTRGPAEGPIAVEAGPAGEDLMGSYATKGRVASFSEGRQHGRKVGRP